MSIEPMLVLSTAHLPQDAVVRLQAEDVNLTRTIPHEYGVIIYASERETGIPELQAVIDVARKLECPWINFDRDADVLDGLPIWEW